MPKEKNLSLLTNQSDVIIRHFQPEDAALVAQLFHDTVRTINRRDYSLTQVQAWAPNDLFFRDWQRICTQRLTYIAEKKGIVVAFGELEQNGHLDCFYCHKNYQGQGIGRQLYQTIENSAQTLNLSRLFVEASITAKPFFERMGFREIKTQVVFCRGETLINYAMEKVLSS